MVFAPHPQHRRVVFVLIDGARHDVLRALLAQGDLPNLARWVIEPGGMTVGTTVFPSTTGVAYIPFLFGRYPGTADVPGIRWLDRGAAARGSGLRSQWRAARSYCGAQASWINRDITCGPSMFELVPQSLAICTPIVRGLRRGAHLMPARRALLGIAAHYFGTYGALDRAVADAWVAAAAEPWRFLFVVFPGPDGLSHLLDPCHALVLDAYRRIDRALGEFVARARTAGELPALFVAADHGASVVREHCDIALALEAWGVPTIRLRGTGGAGARRRRSWCRATVAPTCTSVRGAGLRPRAAARRCRPIWSSSSWDRRPFNSAPGGRGTATSSSRADGSGRASAWTSTASTTSRCWAIRSASALSGVHWGIASCWGARDTPRFQTLRGSWCSSSALHVLVTSCWPPLAAATFARRGRFPSTGQATVA